MAAFLLALILTAPVRWVQQSPRPPVVRVAKPPKRKRIRRVTYRKPPTVIVRPDVVLPISYAEYWAMEQRKREAAALAMWAMLASWWW